jgi:acyl-CoA thioesterase-1
MTARWCRVAAKRGRPPECRQLRTSMAAARRIMAAQVQARGALCTLALVLLAAACSRTDERQLPGDRAEAVVYVALGDSTAAGVGASRPAATYVNQLHARLRGIYPAARLENLGVSGATSADVLSRQLPRAVELAPHLVTLSVGPNDVTRPIGVDAFAANVDRILAALAARTPAVIIVTLLPDLAVTPRFRKSPTRELVERRTREFNDRLGRLARTHAAELVDLYAPSQVELPRQPELLSDDGYHPSDVGYARWAELMWRGVQRHIAAP